MTIKNDTALLTRLCYFLASGRTLALTRACELFSAEEKVLVSWSSVYSWMRDPNIILPEFMGEKDCTFKKAVTTARKVAAIAAVTQSLEDKVANGVKSLVWAHGGEPSWEDDEMAIRMTDKQFAEALEMGLVWPDKKLRDEKGNRVQRTRVDPAPAQLVEMFARSQMRRIYGDKSEINVKGNMNLGVTVMGATLGRPRNPPQVQVIEQPVTETMIEFDEREALRADPGEAVPAEVYAPVAAPVSADEAALMLRAAQGRTEVERDLAQRAIDAMRKAREGKSA